MYGLPKRKQAADGGLIVGPGTGTSDSIEKTVPEGTYILPADTTQQLGFGMPRRNGQSAPAQEQPRLGMPGKQVPVAVSNGEYEMPPQDVHAVGAAVLDQLKNATHQQKGFGLTKAVMAAAKGQQADGPRQFFVDGGLVEDERKPRQTSFDITNTPGLGLPRPGATTLALQNAPRLGVPGYNAQATPTQAESRAGGFGMPRPGQQPAATQQPGLGMPRRATTPPTQQDAPRLGMPGARQRFADGGLVEDDQKLKQNSFDVTNTPVAQRQTGLSPQGVQSMARDAASRPAVGMGGGEGRSPQPSSDSGYGALDRAKDFAAGTYKAAAGAISTIPAYALDYGRQGLAYASDSTLSPELKTYFRDRMGPSLIGLGADQRHRTFEGTGEAVANAIGATPNNPSVQSAGAQQPSVQRSGGSITPERIQAMARESAATLPAASAPSADAPEFVSPAGNGYTQAGNGIAMRTGADGTPEFTNDNAAVSGARTMPAGGMSRVGDGVGGGLSVGEPGDAQMAIDRFERANQERERMIQASRRGEIGEGGGQMTVVEDNSWLASRRQPTLAERQRVRLDGMSAQTDAVRSQAQQGAANSAVERAATTQRMGTEQLNQQRLQQQIAEGDLGVQDRQRLDQLRAQINDPNLSEQQRAQAMEAYNALSITPDARLKAQQEASSQQQRVISDLYKSFSSLETPPTIGEGESARPMSFDEWLQPALRAIQGGGQQGQQQARTSVSRAEVEQTARARGISPEEVIRRLQGVGVTVNG
jgi:hypothetical protein